MHNQPKFIPQRGTSFYADGRSVRPQVTGTVARGQADPGSYFITGLINGKEGDGMPIPVTPTLLERGQERYNIYCSPCHSRAGNGEGMIVQRGYYQAANFHSERLRQAPLGHFVNVMLNGYGAMPMYAAQVGPADRWAIAAYIRALQLSQNAKTADAPPTTAFTPLKQLADQEGMPEDLAARTWGIAAQTPNPLPPAVQMITRQQTTAQAEGAATATPPTSTTSNTVQSAPNEAANAEPAATPAPAPAAGDPAAGKDVYAANCAMCHQATRAGRPPMIPSLIGIVQKTSPEHVHDTVSSGVPDGKPPMPSFADRLSEKDIQNLIAYLKSAK